MTLTQSWRISTLVGKNGGYIYFISLFLKLLLIKSYIVVFCIYFTPQSADKMGIAWFWLKKRHINSQKL